MKVLQGVGTSKGVRGTATSQALIEAGSKLEGFLHLPRCWSILQKLTRAAEGAQHSTTGSADSGDFPIRWWLWKYAARRPSPDSDEFPFIPPGRQRGSASVALCHVRAAGTEQRGILGPFAHSGSTRPWMCSDCLMGTSRISWGQCCSVCDARNCTVKFHR